MSAGTEKTKNEAKKYKFIQHDNSLIIDPT